MPKNEKCFICNKAYPGEIGRWYQYKEDGVNITLIEPDTGKEVGFPQAFVCFKCEGEVKKEL